MHKIPSVKTGGIYKQCIRFSLVLFLVFKNAGQDKVPIELKFAVRDLRAQLTHFPFLQEIIMVLTKTVQTDSSNAVQKLEKI